MPKLGMEPVRRRALIGAAIEAIHEKGSLDVTVGQIARRAGVSSALAHHYFGAKEDLILATMRHLLAELGADLRERLAGQTNAYARLRAIVLANIGERQFTAEVISAWLVFYVMAQGVPGARRLLAVYQKRLMSNLTHALGRLAPRADAMRIAEGTAALIDGIYIRRALRDGEPDAESARALVMDYVDTQLKALRR